MKTLRLVKVADNGVYRLQHEYFRDEDTLLLWRNEGRIGDRPLRLNYCEPGGEPSGPIWGDICRVTVDGVDTPFCKWDRRAWQWEMPTSDAIRKAL